MAPAVGLTPREIEIFLSLCLHQQSRGNSRNIRDRNIREGRNPPQGPKKKVEQVPPAKWRCSS